MTGASDKIGLGSGSGDWQTPPDLYARLDLVFRFTYDAFASHLNHLATLYSTIDGTFRCLAPHGVGQCAGDHYEQVDDRDGLHFPRVGHRVFFNPPFTRGVIDRAVKVANSQREHAELQVGLLPAATDTDWFRDHVMYPVCHVDFTKRVRFIHPPTPCGPKCSMGTGKVGQHVAGQPTAGAPGGLVVAQYRKDWLR